MSSDVLIRPAEEGDFAPASILGAKLVRHHHQLDPVRFPIFYEPLEPGYESFLREKSEEVISCVLVAVYSGCVVGYLFGHVEPHNWNDLRETSGIIDDLYVDESARGLGIGRKLVVAGIEDLRRRGAPQIVMKAAPSNEQSIALFRSLGFRLSFIEMLLPPDGAS